jgi:hypothetical protein
MSRCACGAENSETAKFCSQCGNRVDTSADLPIPLPPIPPEARRGRLVQRFGRIGVIQGRTRAEIEEVVGPPNAVSAAAGGVLLQWMETRGSIWTGGESYHVALLFDADGVCAGVTHESHNRTR